MQFNQVMRPVPRDNARFEPGWVFIHFPFPQVQARGMCSFPLAEAHAVADLRVNRVLDRYFFERLTKPSRSERMPRRALPPPKKSPKVR